MCALQRKMLDVKFITEGKGRKEKMEKSWGVELWHAIRKEIPTIKEEIIYHLFQRDNISYQIEYHMNGS